MRVMEDVASDPICPWVRLLSWEGVGGAISQGSSFHGRFCEM